MPSDASSHSAPPPPAPTSRPPRLRAPGWRYVVAIAAVVLTALIWRGLPDGLDPAVGALLLAAVVVLVIALLSPVARGGERVRGSGLLGPRGRVRRGTAVRRASDARDRTILEQVRDQAIFTLDPDGRNTSWNEGVRNVLGYQEAEFIGRPAAELFTPEDRAAGVPERELAHALESGHTSNDRWMVKRDGARFFAAGTTNTLVNAEGQVVGFVKVMRDISTPAATRRSRRATSTWCSSRCATRPAGSRRSPSSASR
jgi:PAS domain S-box-containing protein